MIRCPCCGHEIPDPPPLAVTFIAATGEVTHEGRTCRLQPAQLEILEHLIDAYPRAIAFDRLLELTYGTWHIKGDVLHMQLSKMRRAFRQGRLGITIEAVETAGRNERHHYALVRVGESADVIAAE